MLQWGKDHPATPAVSALLKLSLQPLWSAFSIFCRKKLELRSKALQGCLPESVHVQNLLASSPLTPDLFDQDEVERVKLQAAQQAKPVFQILHFRQQSKRKASTSRGRGGKRQRAANFGPSSSQQPQQVTAQAPARAPFYATYGGGQARQANFGPQQQGPAFQSMSYGQQRRYPTTPRGRGRGRGSRGGRSPSTPKKAATPGKQF